MSSALTSFSDRTSVPGAAASPSARIARAWVLGETGVLTFEDPQGSGTIALPLVQGGLVTPDAAPVLHRALRAERIELLPRQGVGTGLRGHVARALVQHALVGADRNWLQKGGVPEVTLLAPLAMLDELGLYPRLRWVPGLGGIQTEPTGRAALGLQLRAMERLGLARLAPVPESARASRPPFELRPRSAPTPRYSHCADEEDLFGVSGLNHPEDDEGGYDFDTVGLTDVCEDGVPAEAIGHAAALLDAGQWEKAEQVLLGLRDTRLDDPVVLAWLAVARVADPERRTRDRVADARAWARLARSLAPGSDEVERALIHLPPTLPERGGNSVPAGACA